MDPTSQKTPDSRVSVIIDISKNTVESTALASAARVALFVRPQTRPEQRTPPDACG